MVKKSYSKGLFSYVWGLDFLPLGVRNLYVWGLVHFSLGVSNSYVSGLDFSRLEVTFLTFGG